MNKIQKTDIGTTGAVISPDGDECECVVVENNCTMVRVLVIGANEPFWVPITGLYPLKLNY
jgi:hypothetical protein